MSPFLRAYFSRLGWTGEPEETFLLIHYKDGGIKRLQADETGQSFGFVLVNIRLNGTF